MMNTQTNSKGERQKHLKYARIVFCFAACFFAAVSNVITNQSPTSRILSGAVVEDAQLFQITVTGVPDRVPTIAENMALEAVLYDYLKEELAPKGVRIYSVRVQPGKTIHYRRSLNDKFSITGEPFPSNGKVELDEETLDLFEKHKQRILNQAGEATEMHQISLLILIKGSHLASSGVTDYDELVMSTINKGHSAIITPLVEPSGTYSDKVAAFFKKTQTVVCVGVGPRDDEPYLEMTNEDQAARTSPTTVQSGSENSKSLQLDEVEMSKMSRSEYQSEGRLNNLDSKNFVSGFDYQESYNADAIKFRQVSSIFFLIICSIAALWYAGKIAARKHEQRQMKMALAKKAYEGPRTESNALFNNGKFMGTMDTGAGM